MLALYNPVLDSQRALQQASELVRLQKRLGVTRVSLSEASRVCGARPLRSIMADEGMEQRIVAERLRVVAKQLPTAPNIVPPPPNASIAE